MKSILNTNTPYSSLHPDLILNAIETLDLRCSGSLLSLNSYENRVYQVGMDDASPLIAKFYRPLRWTNAAIEEEHQFALELAGSDIPVVAPLVINGQTLHEYEGFRFALFPRQGGRTIDLDNAEHLEWIGRFIGRIHAVGSTKPFQHRIHLNLETYGQTPYQFLLASGFIPVELQASYCAVVDSLLVIIKQYIDAAGMCASIRLHGDCHIGNILWNDQGPRIVDLDDCLMGPAIQDLWMLTSGNTKEERYTQLNNMLFGYEEFYEFNYREVHLIEALRALRMLHYSAWLAKRWEDPAFPLHFPWFNTSQYWQEQVQYLHDQYDLMCMQSL